MAKVFNYTIILVFLMGFLGLAMSNLNDGNPVTFTSSVILQLFGLTNPANWSIGTLITSFLGIIGVLLIAGGITVSFFGRQPTESYVLIPLVSLLGAFIGDIGSIVIFMRASYPDLLWLSTAIGLILGSLMAGYTIALVQWWRGNDI
jgi:hypothetical protein